MLALLTMLRHMLRCDRGTGTGVHVVGSRKRPRKFHSYSSGGSSSGFICSGLATTGDQTSVLAVTWTTGTGMVEVGKVGDCLVVTERSGIGLATTARQQDQGLDTFQRRSPICLVGPLESFPTEPFLPEISMIAMLLKHSLCKSVMLIVFPVE